MSTLTDKIAVVTGGSRGIGRAVVERLAADGATVVFGYRDDHGAAKDVVDAVNAGGGTADAQRADVSDGQQLAALFDLADSVGGGRLDIVVNNAGIIDHTPIAQATVERFNTVMAINAASVVISTQQAARRMRQGGRIINVSTIGTVWPSPGEALYAASKAAIEQFTRVASRELAADGITVNCIQPGPTDTDLLRRNAPQEAVDGVASMTALGRIGTPTDIANIVSLLAGTDSGWLTGQIIRADGGLT